MYTGSTLGASYVCLSADHPCMSRPAPRMRARHAPIHFLRRWRTRISYAWQQHAASMAASLAFDERMQLRRVLYYIHAWWRTCTNARCTFYSSWRFV
jgi:hypothetical protein